METESRDLIVLGSGPGGYVAAIRAAQLGRQVTIIEREALGGVCLNWGCIPTKALLSSAQLYQKILHAKDFGIEISGINSNYSEIVNRSRDVASKLSQGVQYLMKKNKIEVLLGNATLGKGKLLYLKDGSKNQRNLSFQDLIIASGARPKAIPGVPVDGLHIHTSRTILEHRKQPKDFLVIGAGAIGVEFAYLMHALGTKVTLVEMLDQILPVEDTEVSRSLESILRKQGMIIKTASAVSQLRVEEDRVRALIKQGTSEEAWEGDSCLVAIGVVPNTDNIGLEEIGIELNRGFIKVDAFLRTNVPHYYAIGDVSGPPLLAHKASHEGIIAAEAACGVAKHGMSYDNIPGCTYCQPQVASVGFTERAAKEKGFKYKSAKVPFSAVGKAIATGETEGFLKVIIEEQSGELLGVHILHAEATELISEAAVIRSHEGIAESVLNTIHPHPTVAEATMEAMALALGRPINL